jgi:tetratricopeptide (TPR) repeat protein
MMLESRAVFAILMLVCMQQAHAAPKGECGSLDNGFGPFDYRTATEKQRETVERYHFTQQVEQLRRGQSTVRAAGDIGYTLRAFPNHTRALAAMAELAHREKSSQPKGSQYTVDCWFARAMTFRPDDGAVRVVYGVALLKAGKRDLAIEELNKANELLPNNANVNYNLGLAYLDAKDYDKALAHAKRAYELGFPLPGLRDRLQKAGKWQ